MFIQYVLLERLWFSCRFLAWACLFATSYMLALFRIGDVFTWSVCTYHLSSLRYGAHNISRHGPRKVKTCWEKVSSSSLHILEGAVPLQVVLFLFCLSFPPLPQKDLWGNHVRSQHFKSVFLQKRWLIQRNRYTCHSSLWDITYLFLKWFLLST